MKITTYPEMNKEIANILKFGDNPEQYAAQYITELKAEIEALKAENERLKIATQNPEAVADFKKMWEENQKFKTKNKELKAENLALSNALSEQRDGFDENVILSTMKSENKTLTTQLLQAETALKNAVVLPKIRNYELFYRINGNNIEEQTFIEFCVCDSCISDNSMAVYLTYVDREINERTSINAKYIGDTVFIGENAKAEAESRLKKLSEKEGGK